MAGHPVTNRSPVSPRGKFFNYSRKVDRKHAGADGDGGDQITEVGPMRAMLCPVGEFEEDVEDAILSEHPEAEEPCEARVPRSLFDPIKPSAADVAEHERTHLPYRSWCAICVKAHGKEDSHPRRKDKKRDDGLPEVGLDYNTFGDEQADKSASIVM